MRKYYKPSNIRKRMINQGIDREVCPWSLLRTYVISAAGCFSLDELSWLMSCSTTKSVKKYLAVCSYFDALAQKYEGSESIERVFAHRQVCALLKKYPFKTSDLDIEPSVSAIAKWQAAEEQCSDTNERLKGLNGLYPSWFNKARIKCADVLGELTPARIMKMISNGKHGPGSTLTSVGNRVSSYYKYADIPYSVTKDARLYAFAAISADPKWMDFLESTGRRKELPPIGSSLVQQELMLLNDVVEEHDSDKVTFVPKDCRSDRPIAVGASLNMFMQLGVKAELEQLLKRSGIDLTDQTKNQDLAYAGSKFCSLNGMINHNQFSTIDLASASDTISTELVKALLPPDWFAFLSDLRHETGLLNKETVTYQKFSAMGNGFTFPLESLIFYCVCYGAIVDSGFPCTRNDISVFGDDIIVRLKTTPSVLSALSWSGFLVNEEKSFISGPFKESCGADYFSGTLVRPFYLKKEIRTYEEVYFLCNSITNKIVSSRYRTNLSSLYKEMISLIPDRKRSYGPMPMALGTISSVSSGYLSVPFSFMNSLGLRPWLSESEISALLAAKLIKKDNCFLQSLFYVNSYYQARPYKARESINYMIWLRNTHTPDRPHKWTKHQDVSYASVNGDPRQTYRRKSVKLVTTITPILNWNGDNKTSQLYNHPIFYCS